MPGGHKTKTAYDQQKKQASKNKTLKKQIALKKASVLQFQTNVIAVGYKWDRTSLARFSRFPKTVLKIGYE